VRTDPIAHTISALGLQGLLFAAASISNVKSEDQTPIFSSLAHEQFATRRSNRSSHNHAALRQSKTDNQLCIKSGL